MGETFPVRELDKNLTRVDALPFALINKQYDYSAVCTTGVTNMEKTFYSFLGFNQNISHWDTSNVNNMYRMFRQASSFNSSISNWDTSNVTDMQEMFQGASAFNSDVSKWDTSKVITMQQMFNYANIFNSSISNWVTSNVTNMNQMFSNASKFNSDISKWDTSKVVDMAKMFLNAEAFNQNLSGWCVPPTSNLPDDFGTGSSLNDDFYPKWKAEGCNECIGITCYNEGTCIDGLRNYNCSCIIPFKGKHCEYTFENGTLKCGSVPVGTLFGVDELEKIITRVSDTTLPKQNVSFDYSAICTTGVTDMKEMFKDLETFNQNISYWDTSDATNMSSMFYGALTFDHDLFNWNTLKVENMANMFFNATNFNQDLSSWLVPLIPETPEGFSPRLNDSFLPSWGVNNACMQDCDSPSRDFLGLIIGLSVGGFVLLSVAVTVYWKGSKKASGYVGFTS